MDISLRLPNCDNIGMGTFIQSETGLFMKSILLKLMFGRET